MKNILYKSYRAKMILPVLIGTFFLFGCTENFESLNQDPGGVSEQQLTADFNNIGGYFNAIQYTVTNESAALGVTNLGDLQIGAYYYGGAHWSGYTSSIVAGLSHMGYGNFGGWDQYHPWNREYNQVLAPINQIARKGARISAPDFWAIALILKVTGAHVMTDQCGPMPYSKYGSAALSVAYDTQKQVYNQMFAELDTAVNNLKTYIAANPGARPFSNFDKYYNGDYKLWLKYANSLRLRLAMHIVKVDAVTAQNQAIKAVDPANGGIIASNSESAILSKDVYINFLIYDWTEWGDMVANPSLICYLKGLKDPRLEKWFSVNPAMVVGGPSAVVGADGDYHGVRLNFKYGSATDMIHISAKFNYNTLSKTSPSQVLNYAENLFTLAEAKLRGWNVSSMTVKQLYEAGIQASLDQWQLGGAASAYIADNTSKPADFVDPINPGNNVAQQSNVTIAWDESASNETKLEKIITQKWIAMWPIKTEGWTTFRRTGYPKLFPIGYDMSGGQVDNALQIRRINFPNSESVTNPSEYAKGVILLGGPDHNGTRLWWDPAKGNF